MPGRVSRKNNKLDGELKMRIIGVLAEADDGIMPTIDWIKQQDMILAPHTTQKLSKLLGSLIEMGVVKKGKSKSLGRMVYRLTSRMQEDGYDVEEEVGFGTPKRAWNRTSWELEDEPECD